MTLTTHLSTQDDVHHIQLGGRLDSNTSSTLESLLPTVFQQEGTLALMDCTALDYVSSAGLRVVLMAAKRARQIQGRLVLFGLNPKVREVFEVSGFLKILHVADDANSALQSLKALNA
jgi:anti-anti-sigma factor